MVSKLTFQFGLLMLLYFGLLIKLSLATGENQEIFNKDTNNMEKNESDNERNNLKAKLCLLNLHALRVKTQDHSIALNYLMDNMMTETHMNHIINDFYTKSGPILRSWRDINHLLFDLVLIFGTVYFFLIHLRWIDSMRQISIRLNHFVLGLPKQENSQELTPQVQQEQQQQHIRE